MRSLPGLDVVCEFFRPQYLLTLSMLWLPVASGHAQPEQTVRLLKAFAFGATEFTRVVPNAPQQEYIKVVQYGDNFTYTSLQGHGYTDILGIDDSPNNRAVLAGDDEIYDQFIGATGNGGDIVFRVDAPNGAYRFVAAGGDARFSDHATTLLVRDGSDGDQIVLIDALTLDANEFYTVGFGDKRPPAADGQDVQPNLLPQSESPILEVTRGYVEIIQICEGPANGGDLCLLEVWQIEEQNAQPQVVNPIPSVVMRENGEAAEFDLNDVFADPDSDTLTFSVSNSNEAVVAAELNGSNLLLSPLSGGTAQVTVGASDNLNPEVTHSFAVSVQAEGQALLQASFDSDAAGFEFVADAFRATAQPAYAGGNWRARAGHDGGALRVELGNLDGAEIVGMSGGWRTNFDLANSAEIAISFYYNLTLSSKHEHDEYSEVLVTVNEKQPGIEGRDYVIRISGVDNATSDQTSGWQLFVATLGTLPAGQHEIIVGGYNNQKTSQDEWTEILIDDVLVTTDSLNSPPSVQRRIPDTTLVRDEGELNIDLATVFDDPEGDELSYRADSENEDVAGVSLQDAVLSVEPRETGESTITVAATDGFSQEVTTSFKVTVTAGNAPPFVANPIPDTTLTAGDDDLEIELGAVFQDPDGDPLSFSAESSDEEAAGAQILGTLLIVTARTAGEATITARAADGVHPEVEASFLVTVVQENRPPVIVRTPSDTSLTLDAAPAVLDLRDYFFDPDGDTLEFRVNNSNGEVVLAQLDDNSLTLTPRAEGEADITLLAQDAAHPAISTTFQVSVFQGNRPPVVVRALPDTTLLLDDGVAALELSRFFRDPDGDNLSFSAQNENDAVVDVDLEDQQLELTPLSEGIATVTVRASDPGGLQATTTFQVTVSTNNLPPIVTNPIADTTISLQNPGFEIDLASVFRDPESQPLTYRAAVSDESVIAVTFLQTRLLILPANPGEAIVTMWADDGENPEVMTSFTVTVAANASPSVRNPIPHTILTVGGSDFVADLNDVFHDPESDDMTFTARSSNESIASTQLNGSILSVSPVAIGDVTIHLTADDGNNPASAYLFALTVERANFPPVVVNALQDTTVLFGGQVLRIDLLPVFEDPDDEVLSYTAASAQNGVVVAAINASLLTIAPLAVGSTRVSVTARDSRGAVDSTSFRVDVGVYPDGFRISTAVGYARRENAEAFEGNEYRIVGFPGADNRLLSTLFSGNHNEDWQAYWDNGKSKDYFIAFDGSDSFRLRPGRAFWVIRNGPWHINADLPSAPLNAANSVDIPLHAGFNLITNPYDSAIDWQRIQTVNDVSEPIWTFEGSFVRTSSFEPLTGYYFFNSKGLSVLNVPFALTRSSEPVSTERHVWSGDIILLIAGVRHESIRLGVSADARLQLDDLDYRQPRSLDTRNGIRFARPEWDARFSSFASDFRPPFAELQEWEFEASAATGETAAIEFRGFEALPSEVEMALVARANGRVYRLQPGQRIPLNPARRQNEFKLVFGPASKLEDALRQLVPQEFVVASNYPNPFNPTTTIPISVPEPMRLTIRVFNVLSQEVATLHDGPVQPGRHLFEWHGVDASERRVGTGVYFYKITTDSGVSVLQKMVLVK